MAGMLLGNSYFTSTGSEMSCLAQVSGAARGTQTKLLRSRGMWATTVCPNSQQEQRFQQLLSSADAVSPNYVNLKIHPSAYSTIRPDSAVDGRVTISMHI